MVMIKAKNEEVRVIVLELLESRGLAEGRGRRIACGTYSSYIKP